MMKDKDLLERTKRYAVNIIKLVASYWLEILKESGIGKGKLQDELLIETNELVAIFTTIDKRSK